MRKQRQYLFDGTPLKIGDRVSASWYDTVGGEIEDAAITKMYWRRGTLWVVADGCRFSAECIEERTSSNQQ